MTEIASPRPYKHSRLSLARTLKLAQLAVFEKVAEAGSILAASRELAMTQPAVSKSIRELERHLDGALFVRGQRGVTLTELGHEVEAYAKTMLAELRLMADALNAHQRGDTGHLIVGTLITASTTLLPEAIMRLRQVAPDVTVEVRVGSNATLFPALAKGDIDIVVGFLPDAASTSLGDGSRVRLTHARLYDERLCVVMDRRLAASHPRDLKLRDLQAQEWILPTRDSAAFGAACALFARAKLDLPPRAVYSTSVLTNIGLLTRSPMVALMPRSAAAPFIKAGLVSILPLGSLGRVGAVGYTLRAGRRSSAVLQRFTAALAASCQPETLEGTD